ncbi:MAG TPA: ABC transporter permease [Anaerolineaceae bacterium]|nr:ABC transporter permease [Anaerolineaceae bacterium]
MKQLFTMAFRNLGRNRRRSLLSSLALGIALSLLLLMAGVLRGEMRTSLESSIRLQSGHLQVRAGSYSEEKTSLKWEDLVENPDKIAVQVATLPVVTVATPRLYASGIVANGDNSVGVRIIGVDPTSPANAPLQEGLLSGTFPAADDRQGIYMGQYLADKLGLKSGGQVDLLVNTSSGEVDEQLFTIRGTYTTHNPGFDQISVFMPLAKAQAMTRTENHASTIFVLLKDRDQADAAAAALKGGNYQIKTWKDLNALFVSYEQYADAAMYLLYLIILGITATVIINTLMMSVFERTREIGILSAIGMKSRQIMEMFFAESSLLAVGGILIGLALGGLLVAYASRYGFYLGNYGATGILISDRIYAYLTVQDTVTLTVLTLIISLLAALYPASLAARMEPVEALHGGGNQA